LLDAAVFALMPVLCTRAPLFPEFADQSGIALPDLTALAQPPFLER
jgi:hypothetical protein